MDLSGLDRGPTREFRGIRYANAQRLARPTDVDRWDGDLDATTFGPQAPQNSGMLEKLLGIDELDTSEDCLFLNVFTPGADDSARPVLVWIHGGAFVTGSAAMPWYDGAPLAEKGDVVVVTINYRLGALGFLGDRNLGTLDQISALRWVERNIERFGGDPAAVTIFGESAGGASVVALLAAPDADDLFRAAWSMSPSIPQLRTKDEGTALERSYLDLVGPGTETIAGLGLDVILDAQARMNTSTAGLKTFAPTEGTDTLPGDVLERAALDPRPLVVGTNRDEMLLFTAADPARRDWDVDDIEREFAARFGDDAAEAIEAYREHRPGTDASALVSAMQTDEMFRRPAQRLAERRGQAGSTTWMYLFDHRSTAFDGKFGACHGLDIPFVFDTLSAQGVEMFTGSGADRREIADRFSSALIAFARTGHVDWPVYEPERRATQRFGPEPTVVDDPEPALRRLWD